MAGLPVAQPDSPNLADVSGNNAAVPTSIGDDTVFGRIVNKLTGSNGVERQQLWPERLIRNALSVIPEGLEGKIPMWQLNPQTGEFKVHPEMIEKALDMAALAGTGGLGGAGVAAGETALGGGPFLRPALKYKDKLYKAPQGGQHLDALPKELQPEFQRLAMSGEDISHFNFGFMNHKGQFLDREKALQYAIDEGLLDPHNGKFGVLTSTMMSDSSKPAAAIKALEKPSQLNVPVEPTAANMKKAVITDVPLSTVRDPQSTKMDWTPLAKRKDYDPLVKGYEDLPIAVKLNNGEHLIYDGRHRTVMDINQGAETKKMYVLNAKDYDPANAGRTPNNKQSISDDELLKQLE